MYMKKLTGNSEIEDSLDKLDKLTQEEVGIAAAELLKITHIVEENVQDVRDNVQDIDDKVQGVDDKVQGISSDVKDISSDVRGVDDKVDQANRSLSLQRLLITPVT
jgi:methyl-accepting chemotaxis protein